MPDKMMGWQGVEQDVATPAERKEWAESLSNEELIAELESEAWASDRCVGTAEPEDSDRALTALRAEILRRINA